MKNANKVRNIAFAVFAMAVLFMPACSMYRVHHTETDPNSGIIYDTAITEAVPPGGKKISEGAADIGVDESGAWHVRIGSKIDSDATGTALLIQSMFDAVYRLGLQQATGGVPVPRPVKGVPAPDEGGK